MRKHMHTRETTEGAHVKVVDPIRETLTSGGPKEAKPFLRMADPPHDLIGSSLATRPRDDLFRHHFSPLEAARH